MNPLAGEGYALKRGDVLDFAVRFFVHDGDVEEADVAGVWGGVCWGGGIGGIFVQEYVKCDSPFFLPVRYCAKAGKTTKISSLKPPEKSWSQTEVALVIFPPAFLTFSSRVVGLES